VDVSVISVVVSVTSVVKDSVFVSVISVVKESVVVSVISVVVVGLSTVVV
jgi:hypothetical protein